MNTTTTTTTVTVNGHEYRLLPDPPAPYVRCGGCGRPVDPRHARCEGCGFPGR